MATPHIPNIKTLLGARGGGRGRGRGQGYNSGLQALVSEEEKVEKDKIVQRTDQDASVSRLSAVELGYLDDPFAKLFVISERQRRFPIINRGTYVRTRAIDNLVDSFLAQEPARKKQIISLGAGSDTRFFRLMSGPHGSYKDRSEKPNLVYHEIDFAENTTKKLSLLGRLAELCRHVEPEWLFSCSTGEEGSLPSDTFRSPTYNVHAIDLRTLDPFQPPPRSFDSIDPTLPTLIISECCLTYLSPTAADTVALYFTRHLFPQATPLGLILYEPIRPDDAFGKVMVSNLAARGIVLQTLRKYGSLEAQAERMKAYGFEGRGGADVNELWKKGVDEKERERVAGLEMVDEVEEWELLAGHYCVAWGWRGEGVWDRWKGSINPED